MNNSLAFGWRRAVGALSGDLVAIALLATLSALGLGALLETYPAAFLLLRLLGASYVVWLGWSYLRPAPVGKDETTIQTGSRGSMFALWLHSFGVGISNPKAVLFFAALFPQFLSGRQWTSGPGSSGRDFRARESGSGPRSRRARLYPVHPAFQTAPQALWTSLASVPLSQGCAPCEPAVFTLREASTGRTR